MTAVAVLVGLVLGLLFVVVDVIIEMSLTPGESLAAALGRPSEIWERTASVLVLMGAAFAYARVSLAREDVATASQRYRALAESAQDDIFIVDRDMRIGYVNTHAAAEFDGRPDEVTGRRVDELFRSPDAACVEEDLGRAFAGVDVYSEYEFTFGDTRKWLSTRLVPLSGPSRGRIHSVLGISRDITETKRRLALGEALARVNDVVHARLSIDEILESVCAATTSAAGTDSGMVLTCDGGDWTIRFVQGYTDAIVGTRLGPEETEAVERASRTSEPVQVDDARNDPRVGPALVERFGIRSLIAVPLTTRHGPVGVLLLTDRERRTSFSPEVMEFATRVGTTVSLAIENARLYEEKRDVADALQNAILMLPDRLPGIEFAHEYRAATEVARVGGDFFDLFELRDGRIGVTIGDISGHGIDAAVLTSLVKNAVRIEATQEDRPPDEVVASANELLLVSSSSEIFATVFFGVLDPVRGELAYCSGGHTPGFIVGGEPEHLRQLPANSPLVGAFSDFGFTLSVERIFPDEVLFLYTDGLTEARSDGDFFGEDRLVDELRECSGAPPAEVVRDVMQGVLGFAGGRLRDDLAILSIRPERVRSEASASERVREPARRT